MSKILKSAALLLAVCTFTNVCFADSAAPPEVQSPVVEGAAAPENAESPGTPTPEPASEAVSGENPEERTLESADTIEEEKSAHLDVLQIIFSACILVLFALMLIFGVNIVNINKKLSRLENAYDKLKSKMAKNIQQSAGANYDIPKSKPDTPYMSDEEKRRQMHEKFGTPAKKESVVAAAPSGGIKQTVGEFIPTPPQPVREKTDEEKFMDFFNGDSSASLPANFSVVKLSMNGGSVFTDSSGYECYIYGSADAIGNVKLYPSKLVKSPQMRQYYSAVFDFAGGNDGSVVIIPCDAERNAYGGYAIKSKGRVIL
ncbi:MAG: hypothetical protein IJ062_05700 [Firmicutes bacterium]|nr:hypothetical protein [Bacillota bacterium]